MGGKRILFCLTVILVILLPFQGCHKKKESGPKAVSVEGPPAGELKINFVSPKGKTAAAHEADQLVVIFDRPMAALQSLPEEMKSSFLQIDPSTSGKYRWLGTKTLTFTPDKRFPFSTKFRITIPEGTRSLDNYALPKDFSWTFTTLVPRLVRHFPANKQKWIKPDASVLLVFNQGINPAQARDFISWIEVSPDKKETPVEFTLKTPSAKQLKESRMDTPAGQVLLLQAKKKLTPGFSYYVEVKAGLPGKEGSLGMEKSNLFTFDTFKAFQFLGLESEGKILPSSPIEFKFTNPVFYKEFVKKIRFDPPVTIPEYYQEWDNANSAIWMNLPLKPETDYTVQIDPGLQDEFKNTLGKEAAPRFSTSSYPPSVWMTTGHGILESYGNLKYPIYAINADRIEFQGARIAKENVIPLLRKEKLFWSSEPFSRPNLFQVRKMIPLNLPRNERRIFPLDVQPLTSGGFGLVFIQLDTFSKDKWERYPKVFLQATSLGISAKFSAENNLIWVTDIKSGLPVAGAQVEIRNRENKVKWKGRTDENGKAQSPGWKALGIKSTDKWSKPEQWIFVQKDKDTAFLSSEWGTGIYPYRFGIDYDWNPKPERIRGFIYSDRGIYRAGEEVHLKGIIREQHKGQWQLIRGKTVRCTITDPFSKMVFKKDVALDEFSSFALDFKTGPDAPLGHYSLQASVPGDGPKAAPGLVYSSFRVEAFRPAEFEVILHTLKKSYVFGDDYAAQVQANYMFGGAMAGQKVQWHLRLNPLHYSPPGHKGFQFGNEIEQWESEGQDQSRLLASGDSVLDKKGALEIKAKLLAEEEKDSMSAALEATVQGPSRRSVSSRISTNVHRGKFYIGLRPQTSFLQKGEDYALDVISVAPSGDWTPGKSIQLTLLRREWHSVKKEEMGGRFRWVTEKKDIQVGQKKIVTKDAPVSTSFVADKAGFYILKAESRDSRKNPVSTSTYFYTTGNDYIPWERQDDDAVELVPDKDNYKPGETAKILIKSPYEQAKALVTIEREFILESHVVDVKGSSSQIDIPILPDHIPNVFVSVLLVQGRTYPKVLDKNADLGKPSFKIGYVNLNVDPAERRLSVDVRQDKEKYNPGETVKLKLNVKDWQKNGTKANLSVAVVDLGVLSLIGFQTPDPFVPFNRQKPLSVQTSEIRQHLVGQRVFGEKGDEEGGGGGLRMMAPKALGMNEIEIRGNFKFTAYWNPSIITDANGEASVEFQLPDNLTTFRVMAVAQTKDSRFGRGETTFRVSKPLLLQAALPRFSRIGDKFQGGLVLQNFSGRKGDISVSCEAQGILLQDKKELRTVSLAPGESREVLYSFLAEKKGTARFVFKAKMGEYSDGLEIKIPVLLPHPTETVALSDQCSQSKEEKITIPKNAFPSESRLSFLGSASALTGLKGNVDFLFHYPYPCLEQRLSSILPFVVGMEVIQDFKLSPLSKKEAADYVQKNIKAIASYQKESGGFGLWPDAQRESPFNTCYAAYVLLQANKAGYAVNAQSLNSAASYLRNLVRGHVNLGNYPYSKRVLSTTKAYALYVLALLGRAEPAYAEQLFKERDSLSLFGQTLLLKALFHGKGSLSAQQTLLQELMNKIKVTTNLAHFEDNEGRSGRWIYASNTRTTALILQALMETGSDHPLLSSMAKWLVEKRKTTRWMTTQDNAYMFHALNAYYTKTENIRPDFSLDVSLAGKRILKDMFKGERNKVIQAESSLASFKPGKTIPLKIKFKGKGTLFYEARMTYAPKGALPPRDEGFTVVKEVTALDGTPLESIEAGSLVVVTLRIVVPRESLYVVVDDPLPAGLEAVNPTFVTESTEQQRQMDRLSRNRGKSWWRGFNHIEMHDDRVLLFADSLAPGIHVHRYLARALTFGTFLSPGTKIEEMYAPEVFGRSPEKTVRIR